MLGSQLKNALFTAATIAISTAFVQASSAQSPRAVRATNQRQTDLKVATHLRAHGDCKRADYLIVCVEPNQLRDDEFAVFFALALDGVNALRLELGAQLDIPTSEDTPFFFPETRNFLNCQKSHQNPSI